MHISIQLVEKDQKVKRLLPITFNGQTKLEHRLLMLQILKPDIEVEGVVTQIPDEIIADVSKKNFNDDITAADFNIPADVKILDPQEAVYAVVKNAKGETAIDSDETEAETAEA